MLTGTPASADGNAVLLCSRNLNLARVDDDSILQTARRAARGECVQRQAVQVASRISLAGLKTPLNRQATQKILTSSGCCVEVHEDGWKFVRAPGSDWSLPFPQRSVVRSKAAAPNQTRQDAKKLLQVPMCSDISKAERLKLR